MTWSFRAPLRLPSDRQITWPEKTLSINSSGVIHVYLKADADEDISSAERLSLWGDGFATEGDGEHYCAGQQPQGGAHNPAVLVGVLEEFETQSGDQGSGRE